MERLYSSVMYSAEKSLTYKNAAKKIQKGFRDLHYSMKEKKAALIIERFFIWVQDEVEREIERRKKKKMLKRQKDRTKQNVAEDNILDGVWDETVGTVSRSATPVEANKEERNVHKSEKIKVENQKSSRGRQRSGDGSPKKSRSNSVKRSASRGRQTAQDPKGANEKPRSSIRRSASRGRQTSDNPIDANIKKPRSSSVRRSSSRPRQATNPSKQASPTKSRTNSIRSSRRFDSPVRSNSVNRRVRVRHPSPTKSITYKDTDPAVDLDFDDASSEVSGLTNPTLTPRYKGSKKSISNRSLDDELDAAWKETSQKVLGQEKPSLKSAQGDSDNSSKENSISPPKLRRDPTVNSLSPGKPARHPLSPAKSSARSKADTIDLSIEPPGNEPPRL